MMSDLTIITSQDNEKWDNIVKSFKDYDIYYLCGYAKAFQIHGDGEPLLFYYENDDLRGINVVMKRDIAQDPHLIGKISKSTYFDFSTPYGYGGWILEGKGCHSALYAAYVDWCVKNNIVSEFVRFHPILANHIYADGFYEVIPLGNTIAMDLSSSEVIWENLTSRNRNMIRKAQKSGVRIFNGCSTVLYDTFREIYNITMDKNDADEYYYFSSDFYRSILNDLSQNARLFYAEKDGEIIAASIFLWANDRMNYHLSGSKRNFQNIAPCNLLLYEAAFWGSVNGYKTLHLGGGVGSGEDSLFAFKKSFYRGKSYRYYIGKKIFSQKIYDELVSRRPDLFESNFFPRYRA